MVLRPLGPEDAPVLWALYRSSREEEVSAWGWAEAEVEAFLQMQWQIEQRARALQHPNAEHRMIVRDGRPIGRSIVDRAGVDRAGNELQLVDITLLPEARGQGVGTELLADLLSEADARGLPLVLSVRRGNRAEGLYRRLGFAVTGEDELQRRMVYSPPGRHAAPSGQSGSPECQTRS